MALGVVLRGPSRRWMPGPSVGAALGVGAAPMGGPVWGAPNKYHRSRLPSRRGIGRLDRWGMSKGGSRRTCNFYKGVGAMIGRQGVGQWPTLASVGQGCSSPGWVVEGLDYPFGEFSRGERKGARLPPQCA